MNSDEDTPNLQSAKAITKSLAFLLAHKICEQQPETDHDLEALTGIIASALEALILRQSPALTRGEVLGFSKRSERSSAYLSRQSLARFSVRAKLCVTNSYLRRLRRGVRQPSAIARQVEFCTLPSKEPSCSLVCMIRASTISQHSLIQMMH